MKNLIAMTLILLCTGCTTMKTYNERAELFSNALYAEKDPILVIEAYKNEYHCPTPDDDTGLQLAAWTYGFPFKLGYEIVDEFMDFGTEEMYQCTKRNLLIEPNIKLECTKKSGYNEYFDNSDECVLYRRSPEYHESKVGYFDYKRFLPEKSPIKTDESFLKLVEKYNHISDCEKQKETTTAEKEACREKIKNEIRLLATRTVKCSELKGKEYTEFLIGRGDWYEYAQNHDPYDNINLLRAFGAYEAAAFAYNPVYSQKEAQKEVQKSIEKYGAENLCSVENWKQDMKKLGYYMK